MNGVKKILVVVPHPDDEILVAGPVIAAAKKNSLWEVCLLFVTNGDCPPNTAQIRIDECMQAAVYMGVKDENLFFLGYGDRWVNDEHIYNEGEKENAIKESMAGRRETYGCKKKDEFAMQRFSKHHTYTRKNLKADLKAVMNDVRAEVLIAVDMDSHPDHRATSLLFEECLGEILADKTDYRPIVLKKFAYAGVYEGKNDYGCKTDITQNYRKGMVQTECQNPSLRWEERIRFQVPDDCYTRLLINNSLFRAARLYKSQGLWTLAGKFCNRDIIYWERRCDSLTYSADIRVSSGEGRKLNDFLYFGCENICCKEPDLSSGAWIPDQEDKEKTVEIFFREKSYVKEIVIFEGYGEGKIRDIQILFSNDYSVHTGELKKGANYIQIEAQNDIEFIKMKILDFEKEVKITEIEVYSGEKVEKDFILTPYQEKKSRGILWRLINCGEMLWLRTVNKIGQRN